MIHQEKHCYHLYGEACVNYLLGRKKFDKKAEICITLHHIKELPPPASSTLELFCILFSSGGEVLSSDLHSTIVSDLSDSL